MSLPVFLFDAPIPSDGTQIELTGPEARHAVTVTRLRVGERQRARRFADERRFFAVAFQRGDRQLWPHDGEHQRGQPGTAADVGECRRVFYIRQHGEAIEHVARHLFFSIAHGGQVMHLIPFVEQVEIAGELRALRR